MRFLTAILLAFSLFCGAVHADNLEKEFLMSCTYGVLAGSLVGAASLAFTKQPGKNLNRVARGASLGLYTGIILGLYAVYIVPTLEPNPDDEPVGMIDKLSFFVEPTVHDKYRIDGLKADWTVLRF